MRIYKELDLTSFEFWAGAKDHNFTYSELISLNDTLEDVFSDSTPSETDINDLFWFETDFLCECIGVDVEEYEKR